jgi:metal-sulfur cluster biosynthetic enzyme
VPNARRLPVRIVVTIVLIATGLLVIILPSWLKHGRLPTLSTATTFTDSTVVPPGTAPPDSAQVMAALSRVLDPEIGISIVDLGLVDSLHIDSSGAVDVAIALTTPECPVISQIGIQTAKEVVSVPGVRRVEVRLDPTLPWSPDNLSPKAREQYQRMFRGVVPVAPPSSLLSPPPSHDTGPGR